MKRFPALFGYTSERPNISTCPIHHRLINFPSDTFPSKTSLNNKDNSTNKKRTGIVVSSPINGTPFHHFHQHHHATCQRYQKSKQIATPIVNERTYLFY